ncbi:MAG: biotin-dependent carboxyltransferase [Acidobacteria bacterium]|nr:biotin-dependent carboxyltransferase [Acidobacteriota bacterium]
MSILIQKAGILTTVQDLGRHGYRRFGINPNGAMDRHALRVANILLGNDENTAGLEIHYPAPEIVFEEPAFFALAGADFSAALDGRPVENWHVGFAPGNSILTFRKKISGNRLYLAVRGGFRIDRWLGSASTNLRAGAGGFEGRRLAAGDRLFFNRTTMDGKKDPGYRLSSSLIPFYSSFPTVRIVAGPEFEWLTEESRIDFTEQNYAISLNSDRMGFRLEGPPLTARERTQMVSSAVDFGTVQMLPDGRLIVLMADHQTTGGYPRIGQIASVDRPLVAQLGGNDKIAFHPITVAAAEDLAVRRRIDLNRLRSAVGFRFPA